MTVNALLHALIQAPKIIPAALMIVFIGLLWWLGLMCGKDRRDYIIELSRQAMEAVRELLRGPDAGSSRRSQTPRASSDRALRS